MWKLQKKIYTETGDDKQSESQNREQQKCIKKVQEAVIHTTPICTLPQRMFHEASSFIEVLAQWHHWQYVNWAFRGVGPAGTHPQQSPWQDLYLAQLLQLTDRTSKIRNNKKTATMKYLEIHAKTTCLSLPCLKIIAATINSQNLD